MPSSNNPVLVSCGNFFFRFRNALFPVYAVLLLALTRPHPLFGDGGWPTAWLAAGAAMAVLGQMVRLGTIGYRYIDRGGRGGKVYASKLVTEGVYRHSRNPMYVGNILMVVGFAMFSGSFTAFLATVPLFVFIYLSITSAEERYLRESFGADYDHYCRTVNRFLPGFSGWSESLAGQVFDWRRALRKDYGTMLVMALALILLPLWRLYHLEGAGAARDASAAKGMELGLAFALWLLVFVLKKKKALEDLQPAENRA